MNLPYFNEEGALFLLRWFHIFFGIIWIGLLYYFNFVHGSFMKEAAATAKPDVLGKLLPRAMWWFRWGAFWTMATGLVYIGLVGHKSGFMNSWGVTIGTGAVMGIIMGLNVWFVIWPAQKLIIQNAQQTSAGGQPVPGVAEAGPRALLASRTNTFLSIPLLFFMAASRHLTLPLTPESNFALYWIVALLVIAGIEFNAIKGKLGPLETVKGVVTSGFIVTVVFMVLMAVLL